MKERVKDLIAEQLFIDASTINDTSKFIDDLGADSLDVVQMLIAMENEFGVSFGDDDIAAIKTVEDAVRLIENKKA